MKITREPHYYILNDFQHPVLYYRVNPVYITVYIAHVHVISGIFIQASSLLFLQSYIRRSLQWKVNQVAT